MTTEPGWVTARAGCRAQKMFGELEGVVRRDVEEANAVSNRACEVSSGEKKFLVYESSHYGAHRDRTIVRFVLREDYIEVQDTDWQPLGKARSVLDEELTCLLEFEGHRYHLWEFSRLLLEKEFFREG